MSKSLNRLIQAVTVLSETEPVYVHGNHSLLSELLVNLLDNAVKYNRQNGQVSVKLSKTADNHMVITVSDTGIGIPKDKQNRIFERFYSLPRANGQKSSGLGLAFVSEVARLFNGEVTLRNVQEGGVLASLRLHRHFT